jgi:hypothetical protein
MIFHNSTRKISFSKHQNKAESITWMTLKSSLVISSGSKNSAASMASTASTISVASMTFTTSFHEKN